MSIVINGISNATVSQNHATIASATKRSIPKDEFKEVEAKQPETNRESQLNAGKKLQYNVNETLDQVVVTVLDSKTNEVVKEIPSAAVQEMRARVKDTIGNFIDEAW
ncbi:MAG: flagellar protein FlaG [Spirochaetales bacterium]